MDDELTTAGIAPSGLPDNGEIRLSQVIAEFSKGNNLLDYLGEGGVTATPPLALTDFYGTQAGINIFPIDPTMITSYMKPNGDNFVKMKIPDGAQPGDLLVNFSSYHQGSGSGVNFPGFTLLRSQTYFGVQWKIAEPGDAGTVLRSNAGSSSIRNSHTCVVLRGVSQISRLDVDRETRNLNEISGDPKNLAPPAGMNSFVDIVHCGSSLGQGSIRNEGTKAWTQTNQVENGWGSCYGYNANADDATVNSFYKLRNNQGSSLWGMYRLWVTNTRSGQDIEVIECEGFADGIPDEPTYIPSDDEAMTMEINE